jgi:hypothetical protein
MLSASAHFPEKSGLVNGCVLCAYGIGTMISAEIARLYTNPNDLPPTVPVLNGDDYEYYYDEKVAGKVVFQRDGVGARSPAPSHVLLDAAARGLRAASQQARKHRDRVRATWTAR